MSEEPVWRQEVSAAKERAGSRMVEPQAGPLSALTCVLMIGGLGLFAILVWRVGPNRIGGMLLRVGWALPLVLVPHTLVTVLEALGWWLAFPQQGCPIRFIEILRFTVAAKAIQLVTPSISQAGELVKIHLLRLSGVGADVSIVSVVAATTTITISELLFLGTGLTVVLSYLAIEPLLATSVGLGILLMGLLVAGVL